MAYLTDSWGDGGLVVYDHANQLSRRYTGISTQRDPSYVMIINGVNYGNSTFTTPVDGIAITSDNEAIFYCNVQGTSLYRLKTSILRDFESSSSDIDRAVEYLGEKEPSDGMAYKDGKLFYGSLTTSTYYYLEVDATSNVNSATESVMATPISEGDLHWVGGCICIV